MLPYQIMIIFILVPIIIQGIRISSQNPMFQERNRVHMPVLFLAVGVVGSVISCIGIVISSFVPFNTVAIVITASVVIVSLVFLLMHFSSNIQYSDEFICVTKFFRVHKYTYMDIQGIELRGCGSYLLIMKNGKVHIDGFSVGKEDFYEFVEQKYAENHNHCAVPITVNKLFNGYILEPEPFAVLMCLPCIGLIIISAIATWECSLIEIPQNLTNTSIAAEGIIKDGNTIVLIENNKEYRILTNAISDTDALYLSILQNQTIIMECELVSETAEKEVLSIWRMQVDGKSLATYETVLEAKTFDGSCTVTMLWSGTILYCTLIGGVFYILSHAPQYPRLASLLVKKEYRNF